MWKLALLRVRGYMVCVRLLANLYEPGKPGFLRAEASFLSVGN